ncbi:hypothetical protein DEO72_LG10g2272 [Vigna unguiculata]|uniref:Transmembrane protein n=1 Tax=Vigna unguiculata TaxID=3917 RepID=A0A4D6NES0_VIGUN|nr:hypothetical protein DEO72_LG10g2272 [Vigna unguiculata]
MGLLPPSWIVAEGADLVVANGVRHSFLVVLSSPTSWYVVNAIVVVVTSVGAACVKKVVENDVEHGGCRQDPWLMMGLLPPSWIVAEGADLVVANGVRHSFLVVLSSPTSWYVVNAIVVVVTSVGAAWLVRHFSWLTIFYKVDVSCVFMVAMDGLWWRQREGFAGAAFAVVAALRKWWRTMSSMAAADKIHG